jgi:hypothetical protein
MNPENKNDTDDVATKESYIWAVNALSKIDQLEENAALTEDNITELSQQEWFINAPRFYQDKALQLLEYIELIVKKETVADPLKQSINEYLDLGAPTGHYWEEFPDSVNEGIKYLTIKYDQLEDLHQRWEDLRSQSESSSEEVEEYC